MSEDAFLKDSKQLKGQPVKGGCTMRRKRVCLGLVCLLAVPIAGAEASPQEVEIENAAAELRAYLTSEAESGFSGVVLVEAGGELVLHAVFAPNGSSLARDTCFWIGSVSKSIAAAAVVKLSSQGLLELDGPVSSYVRSPPEDKKAITVHQLLTHTSGLGDTYAADGVVDRDMAIEKILATDLVHPPGKSFSYSSDGYALLGALIEIVAEEPYEAVIQRQILGPAGMTHSGLWGLWSEDDGCPLAPTKDSLGAPTSAANYGFRGPTGIRSTASDLLLWHRALMGGSVLSSEERHLAQAAHAEIGEHRAYGYGWQVVETTRGTRLLAHSGAEEALGHYAFLYRYVDEDVVVILLANSPEQGAVRALRGVVGILFPPT